MTDAPGAGDAPRDVPLTAEEVEKLWVKGQRDRARLMWSDLKSLCHSHERLRTSLARVEAEREAAKAESARRFSLIGQLADELIAAKRLEASGRARAERSEAEVVRLREKMQVAVESLDSGAMTDAQVADYLEEALAHAVPKQ